MLPFTDFRGKWLTPEKEENLIKRAFEQAESLPVKNSESITATISASISLFILEEYHKWLSSQSPQDQP